MKLAIMQPYFFPYLGYYQAINAVDKYILYENLNYIRAGWMNRNRILVKNREPVFITVPVIAKSSYKLIKEIHVDNSKKWQRKTINSIYMNYKSCQYFDEIFDLIERIIIEPAEFLLEINARSIIAISRYLDISTEITFDNSHYLDLEKNLIYIDSNDYSCFPHLNETKPLKKVARVIEICRNEKAECFINTIGGTELYSKDEFKKYGIDFKFIKMKNITYKQFSGVYYPNLSIIDTLMHNGRVGTKALLDEYGLI